MWREMAPDERRDIKVDGYRIVTYSFGAGASDRPTNTKL